MISENLLSFSSFYLLLFFFVFPCIHNLYVVNPREEYIFLKLHTLSARQELTFYYTARGFINNNIHALNRRSLQPFKYYKPLKKLFIS